MPPYTEEPDRVGLTAAAGRMAEGFSKLVSCHLALAKMELAAEAKVLGGALGRVVAFALLFVLVGYALLCGALAVLLARWLGVAGGLAVVGGANVIGGGVGIWLTLERLRARPVLGGSLQEMDRSAAALGAAASEPDGGAAHAG